MREITQQESILIGGGITFNKCFSLSDVSVYCTGTFMAGWNACSGIGAQAIGPIVPPILTFALTVLCLRGLMYGYAEREQIVEYYQNATRAEVIYSELD